MNLFSGAVFAPLVACVLLIGLRRWMTRTTTFAVAVGGVGAALVSVSGMVLRCLMGESRKVFFRRTLWEWFAVRHCRVSVSIGLDGLSLVMLFVVVFVGFWVHLYSYWYCGDEDEHASFLACTNFFVFAVSVLLVSEDLLLTYLGWEWIGVCGYFLIKFDHRTPRDAGAAVKAFLVSRVGDVCLVCAACLLHKHFHSVNFHDLSRLFPPHRHRAACARWVAFLLWLGAVAKSAQIPLHFWLSDAAVSPVPVSALLHSAATVSMGVYLVARTHFVFAAFPSISSLFKVVGVGTIVSSGVSALVQTNVKKILAYSSMGQIGYAFLGLGAHDWNASIFHLMAHAFAKSLLFLAVGTLIKSRGGNTDVFALRTSRTGWEIVRAALLCGSASIASFPVLTLGFHSKESILTSMLHDHDGLGVAVGIVGVFLTALYAFRMFFLLFSPNPTGVPHTIRRGACCNVPLGVLSVCSTAAVLWMRTFIARWILLPGCRRPSPLWLQWTTGCASVLGGAAAKVVWSRDSARGLSSTASIVRRCSERHWGLSTVGTVAFVRPYCAAVEWLHHDPLGRWVRAVEFSESDVSADRSAAAERRRGLLTAVCGVLWSITRFL